MTQQKLQLYFLYRFDLAQRADLHLFDVDYPERSR
jgi:hypothetical protein